MNKKINLAIISPNEYNYSETFIRAQKELLPFNKFCYYRGFRPSQLEGHGPIISTHISQKVLYKVKKKAGFTSLNYSEYQVARSLKKNRINLVYALFGPTGQAMVSICESLGIPLIVYFFGVDVSSHDLIKKNNYYINLFSYAKKVICVSESIKASLIKIGCNKENLVVNICGPSDSFLEIKAKFSHPQFIGIGRFTDKKAPYYTILAFNKVLDKFSDARLVIIGNGALYNTCKNLIKYLGISHAVNLPGTMKPEGYMKYFEESIAFLQHSITADDGDREGTPVAILEASASGLPIISTNHAGIPDIVEHAKTGLLVEEHDVDGMANAMMELLNDNQKARTMGNAGKQRIKDHFSMSKHISGLEEIIKSSI